MEHSFPERRSPTAPPARSKSGVWRRAQRVSHVFLRVGWGTAAFGFFALIVLTLQHWQPSYFNNLLVKATAWMTSAGACSAVVYAVLGARKFLAFLTAAAAMFINLLCFAPTLLWNLNIPC
jgi:hypothetical protein